MKRLPAGALAVALAFALTACDRAGIEPRPLPAQKEAGEPAKEKALSDLHGQVGALAVITGSVSRIMWTHIVGHVPRKREQYFDLDQGGQTVIYIATPLPDGTRARLTGRIMEVRGAGEGSKGGDSTERHLDVTHVEVLPPKAKAP